MKHCKTHNLWHVAVAAALTMSAPLGAVDYGGEKSFLFEIPYKVCLVAPLPEEAKKRGLFLSPQKRQGVILTKGRTFTMPDAPPIFKRGGSKVPKRFCSIAPRLTTR
jgi:hypothetical protein